MADLSENFDCYLYSCKKYVHETQIICDTEVKSFIIRYQFVANIFAPNINRLYISEIGKSRLAFRSTSVPERAGIMLQERLKSKDKKAILCTQKHIDFRKKEGILIVIEIPIYRYAAKEKKLSLRFKAGNNFTGLL